MSKEINTFFDTGYFNKIVMGVVAVALRNCGYSNARKAEIFYEMQEALDTMSAEEFEQAYHEYLVSGK